MFMMFCLWCFVKIWMHSLFNIDQLKSINLFRSISMPSSVLAVNDKENDDVEVTASTSMSCIYTSTWIFVYLYSYRMSPLCRLSFFLSVFSAVCFNLVSSHSCIYSLMSSVRVNVYHCTFHWHRKPSLGSRELSMNLHNQFVVRHRWAQDYKMIWL